jgi:hypothetical protein
MTVEWSTYAQALTSKPVKGMLTGPVTILAWSFVRTDQPLADTADPVALALRDECQDLETVRVPEHPGHDRGDPARRVRALVRRQPHPVSNRVVQSRLPRQAHHRHEARTGHQIRIVERCAHHRSVMA